MKEQALVTRLDNIVDNHVFAGVAPEELVNGTFYVLDELVEGETDLYKVTKPTDVTKEVVLLHHTPEVDPDPRKTGLKHFRVAEGENARFNQLSVGDIVTFTEGLFEEDVKVGDVVCPQNSAVKLAVGEEARLTFKVIEETTLGMENTKAFAIKVLTV